VFSAEYSGKIMLLVMEDQNAERLEHTVRHAVQAVLPEQWTYTLGRGSFRPYHELYLSYNEALIPFDDQENYRNSQHQEDQMITQIRKSVSRNEPFAEISRDLQTFLELLHQDDSLGLLKGKLTMLFSLLYDDLKHSLEKINHAEHGAPQPDPVRELVKLASWTACEQWAVSTLRSIVETAKAYQHENRPLPLRKAILFIDSHYHEPIQLSAAAEQCEVSPAYLSRLFSEHLHMSFVDYITHIRIRKAEEMLKKRAASVKETAYAVGYHDPNYFSKIFKKYTGRTPSSYS
jgi:two-component system response regulator YesN